MKDNVLLKDTLRTISKSASRFFSVVLIVALGVSFFAGLNATAPFMRRTISEYYKETNLSDIRILSKIGFEKTDVETISSINGIEAVSGEKFVDGVAIVDGNPLTDIDGSKLTVRAYELDVNKAVDNYVNGTDDREFMNRPSLVEGNWPKKSNECLVDQSTLSTPEEFQIGAKLRIEGDGSDIETSLSNTEYTIVGIIRTPLYINYERGNTTIGTGKLGTFVYLPSDNFVSDYYSAISVKISGSEDYDPYSEEYKAFVQPYLDFISSFSSERARLRAGKIKADYAAKVASAELEYATKKAEVERAIIEGEAEVKQILDLAENGDKKLAEYKATYNEKAAEARQGVERAKLEHSEGYAEYEKKLDRYNKSKELVQKYASAELNYRTSVTEYNVAQTSVTTLSGTVNYLERLLVTTRSAMDGVKESKDVNVRDIINRVQTTGLTGAEVETIIGKINSFTAVGTAEEFSAYLEPELQNLEIRLANTKVRLASAQTELAEKKARLEKAKLLVEKLKEIEAKLVTARGELEAAKLALRSAGYDIQLGELEVLTRLSDLKNQIASYETAVKLAKEKVGTIEEEFERKKLAAYDTLKKNETALNTAKSFLLELDNPKWIVSDRDDAFRGYNSYGRAISRTAALSIVFPWFFFLVAALVSLNTMTRMIEEERTRLGTLKAMGFRNKEILVKYLFYSLLASIVGALAGSFMGFAIFPLLITKCYEILFDVPKIVVGYDYLYAGTGIIISVGAIVLSTYIAAKRALKIHPSILMKPKSPKGGKKIPLERLPKLWGMFSFNTKITFRNVFRNKKRFIMAVFGVMGCTALLVSGFGLDDSTNSILKRQFSDDDAVWCYDMQIVLNGSFDITAVGCDAENVIANRSEIGSHMFEYMKVFRSTNDKAEDTFETYIMVPENNEQIPNYIRLREQGSKKPIRLNREGCVITAKLARKLGLGIGDSIFVEIEEGKHIAIPVSGIAENYCFHYIYLSKRAYFKYFKTNPAYNYIVCNLNENVSDEQRSGLARDLMSEYEISAVSYASQIRDTFKNTLTSIDYVVVIFIVSAALMAFVVLYNLSSLNINERFKELATVKVLGFSKKETYNYIFRENIMLSAIGTFLGLFVGIGFHRVVIIVSEVDILSYGREISPLSFLLAAALSMLFTLLVNVVLTKTINKIDMVESLKSHE